MSSTNKTEHLSLSSWLETDRPQRTDFNSDNEIIDTALGEHLENEELHLSYEEKMWLKRPYAELSYTGNGAESRMVTLPIVSRLVIVARENYPFSVFDANLTKVYGTVISKQGASCGGAEFNSMGGITVKENAVATDGVKFCLNQSGVTYRVIAFR